MTERSENFRFGNLHTIILILIICLGLLSLKNSAAERNSQKKPVPVSISVNERSAIPTSVFKVQIFQKSWIANKDSYKLLAFHTNPLISNRKTDIKISYQDILRQSFVTTPQSILRYHLFPPETDDPNC
jgi:hypothetical protein